MKKMACFWKSLLPVIFLFILQVVATIPVMIIFILKERSTTGGDITAILVSLSDITSNQQYLQTDFWHLVSESICKTVPEPTEKTANRLQFSHDRIHDFSRHRSAVRYNTSDRSDRQTPPGMDYKIQCCHGNTRVF